MNRSMLVAGALGIAGLLAVLGALVVGRGPGQAGSAAKLQPSVTAPSLTTTTPSGKHRALRAIWGPAKLPSGASAIPTYKRLGVDVIQVQVQWSDVALRRPAEPRDPTDPAYRWPDALDAEIRDAADAGIQIAVMVKSTPDWANGNRGHAQAPARDRDYADFLRAAASRFPAVHLWMVWGETTRPDNFQPMPAGQPAGPRRYATLLDAAFSALKAVSPDNIVIGGMTWTVGDVRSPDFVKWLRLPNGERPRMDLWGHNPYATRSPDIERNVYAEGVRDISDIDTLYAEIKEAYKGQTVPELWLSEFSVSSDRDSRGFNFHVSRDEQARWVTSAYELADAAPYVRGLGWYELLDRPTSEAGGLTEGLLAADGSPKPAFSAYQAIGK